MGWGYSRRSDVGRHTYDDVKKLVDSARCRESGKPMQSGMRAFDRGTHLVVKYYNTDIVKYYPDGSIEVTTRWPQPQTTDKIGSLTGKWLHIKRLPNFNGRRPSQETVQMMDGVIFNSVNGYLRFDKNGVLDRSTVAPIKFDIIDDVKAASRVRRRASTLAVQVRLRRKLGLECRTNLTTYHWLKDNLHLPDDEIRYDCAPRELDLSEVKPMWFAEMVGATKTVQFMEFA
jgi:hypothetical protein